MMLQELCEESNLRGLRMNISKTKVMEEDNTPIYVNNTQVENVESYVYLGQCFSLRDKNQDKEILRRITTGWTAYAKHRDIFKSNFAICLKRKVYNLCVLPAMTYGTQRYGHGNMATRKTSSEKTSGHADKNGED